MPQNRHKIASSYKPIINQGTAKVCFVIESSSFGSILLNVVNFETGFATVAHERYRYFIELRPSVEETATRNRAQEERHRHALDFIHELREWLCDNNLPEKVQTLDVTVFGQIQITCEADIIDRVREQEETQIAVIRQASAFTEGMRRLLTNRPAPMRRSA